MVATFMRVYSYIYHLILTLLMLGVSGVVLASGSNMFRLEMLPWTGQTLTMWLLWGGLAGLAIVILAVTRIFKYLFPIWALVVLVMMVRGYLIRPYTFSGMSEFRWVLLLIFGALLAFIGSLLVLRTRPRRA